MILHPYMHGRKVRTQVAKLALAAYVRALGTAYSSSPGWISEAFWKLAAEATRGRARLQWFVRCALLKPKPQPATVAPDL